MKLVSLNLCGRKGSTGKIVDSISEIVTRCGGSAWKAFPDDHSVAFQKNDIRIGISFFRKVNRRLCMISGFMDCLSPIATFNLICKIKRIKPDLIHLHNLHGCFLNLPMLFHFLKKNGTPIIWTLHDCWAFTGQCSHYTISGCSKWQDGCHHCLQYRRQYPESYVDRTQIMWKLKKKWFSDVPSMTLVTPSVWLAEEVRKSYLKEYPIKVINNGIDLNLFKPSPSDFREKYNCVGYFIVLGVAFGWGERKGLDVFIELSKRLSSDYKIILVGTDERIESCLPSNIISIHRTNNQKELAEIYTAADVFANPTREENFPTVNIESLACGTPVITFKTGGSPEIPDKTSGIVVEWNDTDGMEKAIRFVHDQHPFTHKQCQVRAEMFDMDERYEEYLALYSEKAKGKYDESVCV